MPAALIEGPLSAAFDELAANVIREVALRNDQKPPTHKVEIKHN